MKLRRNECCPIHRSLFCCGRKPVQKIRRQKQLTSNASMIRTIIEDIVNFDPIERCED